MTARNKTPPQTCWAHGDSASDSAIAVELPGGLPVEPRAGRSSRSRVANCQHQQFRFEKPAED